MSQTDKAEEHRRAPRNKTLKGARIVFPNGISTIACRIRDQSETGALIVVELASTIPDEFNLILDGDDRKQPCNVAWRRAGRIGVKYVEALTDRRHHVDTVSQQEAAKSAPAPAEPDQKNHSRLLKKPIRI